MRYHTGVNLHTCQYCKQEFNVRVHLVEHLRIHTGEKLFQCHICKKQFGRKFSYKVHMRDVEKIDISQLDLPTHGMVGVSEEDMIEETSNGTHFQAQEQPEQPDKDSQ